MILRPLIFHIFIASIPILTLVIHYISNSIILNWMINESFFLFFIKQDINTNNNNITIKDNKNWVFSITILMSVN